MVCFTREVDVLRACECARRVGDVCFEVIWVFRYSLPLYSIFSGIGYYLVGAVYILHMRDILSIHAALTINFCI